MQKTPDSDPEQKDAVRDYHPDFKTDETDRQNHSHKSTVLLTQKQTCRPSGK